MPPTRMQEDRTPSSRRSSESMSEMCDSCHVTILVITASKRMQVYMYMLDLCQIILTALSDGAFASAAAPGGAVGIAAVACSAGTIVVVCSGF